MVMRPCNSDVTRAWDASTSHRHVFARQCLVVRGRRGVIVSVTTAEALTMIGWFAAADELVRFGTGTDPPCHRRPRRISGLDHRVGRRGLA